MTTKRALRGANDGDVRLRPRGADTPPGAELRRLSRRADGIEVAWPPFGVNAIPERQNSPADDCTAPTPLELAASACRPH